MKRCFLILLVFVYSLVNAETHSGNLTYVQKKDTETMLSGKIFRLIEVKQLDKDLKKLKKANASVWVYSKPTKENPYYTIYVGYNGPDRYETRYNFRIKESYINLNNFEQYLELWNWNDKYIPLLQWRKSTHKSVS